MIYKIKDLFLTKNEKEALMILSDNKIHKQDEFKKSGLYARHLRDYGFDVETIRERGYRLNDTIVF